MTLMTINEDTEYNSEIEYNYTCDDDYESTDDYDHYDQLELAMQEYFSVTRGSRSNYGRS